MNKISLLCPSRERLNLNLTFICSIITTVSDINNIELLFGIDDDDPTLNIMKKIVKAIPFIKIIPIHNNGQFIGINKIWNILAENCKENIMGYVANDMIFRTPNWDVEILKEFENNCPKDNIYMVHCNDGYHGPKLSVNAFVHKKYYEIMGYFTRPEFLINWSDRWMFQTFNAFNRIKYKPDIFIEHNHWVFNRRTKDNIAERMGRADEGGISDKLWNTLAPKRVEDIKKLGRYLNLQPDWSKVET